MAIVRDASSPAAADLTGNGAGGATGTSASFTPPANAWVYANVSVDSNGVTPTFAISNTGAGLSSWTQVAVKGVAAGHFGAVAVYRAFVNSSVATTVTATVSSNGTTDAAGCGHLFVDVWTGANSSQTGAATVTGTSTTTNISPTVTTTASGSQVAGIFSDGSGDGVPTSSDTITGYTDGTTISGARVYKASNSGAPGAVAVNCVGAGVGTDWSYALYEILAPSGNVSVNLTGQAITSTEGTVTPAITYGLTGQAIASTLGTITAQVSYALTGQAITSTEGTPTPTVSYALTGQSITSTEGTITASTGGSASRNLVGQTITSSLGVITAQWSASQSLVGQRITSALGTITATVTTDTFLMPNLVLLNYYEALEMLQNLGIYIPLPAYAFAPSSISVQWQKSGYPSGLIIAQSPIAGAGVNPGQNILLTLSAFPFGAMIDNPPDWRQ